MENGIPGTRKEIRKEETYNKYGDAARYLKSMLLGNMGPLRGCRFRKYRTGISNCVGGFVCAVVNKPIPAGYAKTGAYVDENRKLDSRFRVKGFQEFEGTNASAPTVQLQIIGVVLAVIAYQKWNIREMGVS